MGTDLAVLGRSGDARTTLAVLLPRVSNMWTSGVLAEPVLDAMLLPSMISRVRWASIWLAGVGL